MFEQSSRVPLVISWPKRWTGGQRRAGASSHLDLVKTVAEIGGARVPADWDGASMVPWMDQHKHAWKDCAVSEYYGLNVASGYVMIRPGDWKYTYHTVIDKDHPAERELYDLKSDPQEFTNLAAPPQHQARIQAMHRRMLQDIGGDPDETEQRAREQLARGYSRTDPRPEGATEVEG